MTNAKNNKLLVAVDGNLQKVMDEVEPEVRRSLNQSQDKLIAAGFDGSKLTLEIVRGASSRAAAIVEVAEQGGFDTIVLGRRGLSRVQQFFAGRVSTKVLQIG
jgi:nucleotide-binding universal stress UspA family protein